MIRDYQGISPDIHETAWIDESAVAIGRLTVGADSAMWPCSVARADVNTIRIGERTNIQDGSVLHVTGPSHFSPGFSLEIGNEVTVGHAAVLHACTIEDLCLIGMHATILDGAVVEHCAMIAAHALVPPGKRIESGFLWVGSPVKRARVLTDAEFEFLKFSAQDYVELKDKHILGK